MNKDHEKLNKKLEHQLELNSINDELLKSCPKKYSSYRPSLHHHQQLWCL